MWWECEGSTILLTYHSPLRMSLQTLPSPEIIRATSVLLQAPWQQTVLKCWHHRRSVLIYLPRGINCFSSLIIFFFPEFIEPPTTELLDLFLELSNTDNKDQKQLTYTCFYSGYNGCLYSIICFQNYFSKETLHVDTIFSASRQIR